MFEMSTVSFNTQRQTMTALLNCSCTDGVR